jgi:hypothetical protein
VPLLPPSADPAAPRLDHVDRLHLHVGLPKTATTFLQLEILRRLPDVHLVHRLVDDTHAAALTSLRRYVGHGRSDETPERMLMRLVTLDGVGRDPRAHAGAPGPRPWVLSNESLALGPRGFWRGRGPDPAHVARRLRELVAAADPSPGWGRVIVGIRRQEHWLLSRYAQSSKSVEGFSQDDLEARLRRMLGDELQGPARWIDYAEVLACFTELFGTDHVLFVPVEGLDTDPESWLETIGAFVGASDILAAYRTWLREDDGLRRNVRSVDGERWALADGSGQVQLTDELRALVGRRFAASNRVAAERTGIDLAALGYAVG